MSDYLLALSEQYDRVDDDATVCACGHLKANHNVEAFGCDELIDCPCTWVAPDAPGAGEREGCAACGHLQSDHEDGRGECSVPIDNSYCGCSGFERRQRRPAGRGVMEGE